MRTFSIIALLIALCLSAKGAPLVTNESFNYYNSNFSGGYVHGWKSTLNTTNTQSGSWIDELMSMTGTWTMSTASSNRSSYDSTTFLAPNSSNAGTGPYVYKSITNSINTYFNTATSALQGTHVNGGKYSTEDNVFSMGIYSFDCRDLNGQSGACSGSDVGFRQTTNQGLGGFWFSFDILSDGTIANYDRGDISPWENVSVEVWNRSWPSVPFDTAQVPTTLSGVPEPATYGMMGLGLAGLGLLHRRKK